MSRVYVVTDSAATIESAVVKRLGITVVPLTVRIEDQRTPARDYRDGEDFTSAARRTPQRPRHIPKRRGSGQIDS